MPIKGESGIVISQLRADRDRLQETIEKIRAEIKEETRFCPLSLIEGLERALEIIDKYTAEKE